MIKPTYRLWVTPAERVAMARALSAAASSSVADP